MAVYTRLDTPRVAALWARTGDARSVERLEAMPQGSINTTYRVTLHGGALVYLRVNEGKAPAAVEREHALLDVLAAARLGVTTPRVLGPLLPLAEHGGKLAAFFDALPGQDITAVDVGPAHAAQLGAFLARAHRALLRAPRAPNPYGARVVRAWLAQLAHPAAEALRARHEKALARRRPLLRGTIHGDLFVDNTKWRRDGTDELAAVFDWEMAGTDHLLRDLAICLNAWCFLEAEGRYDEQVARALVDGYQRVRKLAPSERRAFFVEAELAAVRFAVTRIRDFEVNAEKAQAERAPLDYRLYVRRLDVLSGLGDRGVRALVGVA